MTTARPVPGQKISRRLFARVASRPRIGPSSGFYARFGLDDPWEVGTKWQGFEEEEEDLFRFLSAAPYYARLRRRAQGRARLLKRLTESRRTIPLPGERFMKRAGIEGVTRGLRGLLGMGTSSIVWLEPEERTTEDEETAAPRRVWGPPPRQEVEVQRRAEEISAAMTRKERAELVQIIREVVVHVPRERRVEVMRREVRRRLRGPVARVAITEIENVIERESRTGTAVARSRFAGPRAAASKGLRPVLSRSPAVSVASTPQAPRPPRVVDGGARRRVVVPVARPEAVREARVVAPVVRESRTQRVTSRGGPAPVDDAIEASVAPRATRLPTERVAILARTMAAPTREEESGRGMEVLGLRSSDSPSPVARVSARLRASTPAQGRILPSVTAYLRDDVEPTQDLEPARRTTPTFRASARGAAVHRRSRVVAAAPTSYVRPEETVEEAVATQGFPARRAPAVSAPAPTTLPGPVAESPAPLTRAALRRVPAATPPTSPTVRAVERLAVVQAPARGPIARSPVAHVAPAPPVVHPPQVAPTAPAPASPWLSRAAPERSAPTRHAVVRMQEPERRRDSRGVALLSPAPAMPRRARRARVIAGALLAPPEPDESVETLASEPARPRRPRTAAPAVEAQVSPEGRSLEAVAERRLAPRWVEGAVPEHAPATPAPSEGVSSVGERALATPPRRRRLGIAAAPMRYVEPEVPAEVEGPTTRAARRIETGSPAVFPPAPRVRSAVPAAAPPSAELRAVAARGEVVTPSAPRRAGVARAEVVDRPSLRAARRVEAGTRTSRASYVVRPTAYVRPVEETPEPQPMVGARVVRTPRTAVVAPEATAPEARAVGAPAPAAPVEGAPVPLGTPRESAVFRALRRAEAGQADETRLAPIPTAYVAPEPEPQAAAPVAAPPAGDRPTLRAARRDLPVAREDSSGRALTTGGAVDYARPATRAAVRRMRGAAPAAVVLQPAAPAPEEPGVAARRRVRRAPTISARARAPREPRTITRSERAPATHAAARLASIEAPRGPRRRVARAALPYMRLVPVDVGLPPQGEPVRAPRRRPEPGPRVDQLPTRRPVLSSGDLREVLRQVSATVRAVERSERTVLVVEASRRAMGGEASVVVRRVSAQAEEPARRIDARLTRDERGAIVRASTRRARVAAVPMSTVAPAAATDPAASQVGWAEGRGRVARVHERSASPGSRTVRRAWAGAAGLDSAPLQRASARGLVRAEPERGAMGRARPVRSRAMHRTSPWTTLVAPAVEEIGPEGAPRPRRVAAAAPTSRAVVHAPFGYGLGPMGLPSTGRVVPAVDEATGLAEDTRHASGWYSRAVDGRPVGSTRRMRTFGRTLGVLARRGAPSAPAETESRFTSRRQRASVPRHRAFKGAVAPEQVLPAPPEWAAPAVQEATPGWARRAVHGTAVQQAEGPERPWMGRGGILNALARASRPEDVVRVIVERGESLRGVVRELPPPALRLIERIVKLEHEAEAAPETRVEHHFVPVRDYGFIGGRTTPTSTAAPSMRGLSPRASAQSTAAGAGSTQVMKLAKKLMNLIHLAESQRKVADARAQVRMAEDSAAARAEGRSTSASQEQEQTPNIQALQREVLQKVIRELELSQIRRQEDPDGRDIWW